jgi:secondary thiamine-phosphate synthase enzyme
MPDLTVRTRAGREVIDITPQLERIVHEAGLQSGLCHAFVLHTTAALTAADLDPGTDLDMLDAFTAMIPRLRYRHPHNPTHAPDHILAALVGPDVTVPVRSGRLALGAWQRIVLFEFNGPRERRVVVSLVES